MKKLILSIALAGASSAYAAEPPPCWPTQIGGAGLGFKTGATPDGKWAAWTCVVKGKREPFGVWAATDYQIVHPDTTGMTPAKTAAAYWKANVVDANTEALQRLRKTALDAVRP